MGESERALYVPSQQPALVKTEAATSATPTPPQEPPAVGTMSSSLAPATKVDNYGQKHFQLSTMLKDATPQLLESAVEASVKLLDTLKAPLADKMPNSPDAEHWIEQIDRLKKQAVKTKTVIGVVGNTGAGKSSVINAMLEVSESPGLSLSILVIYGFSKDLSDYFTDFDISLGRAACAYKLYVFVFVFP